MGQAPDISYRRIFVHEAQQPRTDERCLDDEIWPAGVANCITVDGMAGILVELAIDSHASRRESFEYGVNAHSCSWSETILSVHLTK